MRKLSTLLVFSFVLLSGGLLFPSNAYASCWPNPFVGRWGNLQPDGYIQEIQIDIDSCSDFWSQGIGSSQTQKNGSAYRPRILVKTHQADWGWDILDSPPKSYPTTQGTDIRQWANATTTQFLDLLPDGRLKVTTLVDYNPDANKEDFERVDYLFNSRPLSMPIFDDSYPLPTEEKVAYICGLGCIFGRDVKMVVFVIWTSNGNVFTTSDYMAPYCAVGDGFYCTSLPLDWYEIEARMVINGQVEEFVWKRGTYVSPQDSWIYNEYTNPAPNSSNIDQGSTEEQTKDIVETNTNDNPSPPDYYELILPQPTTSANCQRPVITEIYATLPPEGSTAVFRLRFTVEGADKILIFGHEPHGLGYFDVWQEEPGNWIVWAKSSGTEDNCYAQRGLYVTP